MSVVGSWDIGADGRWVWTCLPCMRGAYFYPLGSHSFCRMICSWLISSSLLLYSLTLLLPLLYLLSSLALEFAPWNWFLAGKLERCWHPWWAYRSFETIECMFALRQFSFTEGSDVHCIHFLASLASISLVMAVCVVIAPSTCLSFGGGSMSCILFVVCDSYLSYCCFAWCCALLCCQRFGLLMLAILFYIKYIVFD